MGSQGIFAFGSGLPAEHEGLFLRNRSGALPDRVVFSLESDLILLEASLFLKTLPWAPRAQNPKFCGTVHATDRNLQGFLQLLLSEVKCTL